MKSFRPIHSQNRMRDEGDVEKARKSYFSKHSFNLEYLLRKRYSWMNEYIKKDDHGVEMGAGTGFSKFFINNKFLLLTDFSCHEWLDIKNVDALHTPFDDCSYDYVVTSNMIHHVPHPIKFLKEMKRILKPGGVLLIQDITASFFMRMILRLMRHEGYDFGVNVFDSLQICTDSNDLWSANCAISNLLFDNREKFEKEVPSFKILKHDYSEFFIFLNSGGVIAKTFYVPLTFPILRFLDSIDNFLVNICPHLFALQTRVVLKKTECL
jgi:SAM-dependent methyltransferase